MIDKPHWGELLLYHLRRFSIQHAVLRCHPIDFDQRLVSLKKNWFH